MTMQVVLVWVVSVQLMANILALDQSSRVSGYAIFQDNVLTASGTFTVSDHDMGERLVKIRNYIINLIQKHKIDQVLFEEIQYQKQKDGKTPINITTYKALAEVFGVCEELFAELGMPAEVIPSSTWKSGLGIKGANSTEQKKNAQVYVLNTYNKKVSQDECDAICIGSYYIKQNKSAF